MEDYEFDQSHDEKPEAPPVEVPKELLSAEALAGVIENFILREGTDYGSAEVSYDAKAQQVHRQIDRGDIKIVFDPNTESVTLMTKAQWAKRSLYAPN